MAQAVSDVGSNAEENIAHAAKIIGRSSHRKRVFDAIYTGKRRAKSVSQLMKTTGLSRTRVLDAGKKLADNHIVKAIRQDGETAYEKIGFFHSHKRKILGLADSPAKLKSFPTKRNPVSRAIHLTLSPRRAQITTITVDDIDSFRKVSRLDHGAPEIGDELSETEFKNGVQRIVGEDGRFKDWGGEVADLFTTRFRISGRRRPVAIAFKGPGTKGKLTPGKMGKNGDQIQRLFEAPAEAFLVQYCRQIDLAVPAQMKQLAIAKSLMTGTRVYYGVIDGKDSKRIVLAYAQAFKKTRGSRKRRA